MEFALSNMYSEIYSDNDFKTMKEKSQLTARGYRVISFTFEKPFNDESIRILKWTEVEFHDVDPILKTYKPKTPIGKALLKLREAYIKSGRPLLSLEEIEDEVRKLRGGLEREY